VGVVPGSGMLRHVEALRSGKVTHALSNRRWEGGTTAMACGTAPFALCPQAGVGAS